MYTPRYSKKELKDSLYKGISIVERDEEDWKWVTYDQIAEYYKRGYRLLNEDKRKLYER